MIERSNGSDWLEINIFFEYHCFRRIEKKLNKYIFVMFEMRVTKLKYFHLEILQLVAYYIVICHNATWVLIIFY